MEEAQVNAAIAAIRSLDRITVDEIHAVLSALTSKMVAAGFAEIDIEMMDETNDFICGEMA